MERERKQNEAMTVSVVGVVCNFGLALLKLAGGIFGHSQAMISDAVNSSTDVISTFIVMAGLKVAGRKPDEAHPYGHERYECVAAIILSVILVATGLGIGWSGIMNIRGGNDGNPEPELIALVAAVVSIITKGCLYVYTKKAANKFKSPALLASAYDHRSDSVSSFGSLLGIVAAKLGYPVFDPVAAVLICLFILKSAVDIFRDAMDKMVDKACDDKTVEKLRTCIEAEEGVLEIDNLNTRLFGSKIYVDVEISVDSKLSLTDAHTIAERVHSRIETEFTDAKHCMVHVNPREIA